MVFVLFLVTLTILWISSSSLRQKFRAHEESLGTLDMEVTKLRAGLSVMKRHLTALRAEVARLGGAPESGAEPAAGQAPAFSGAVLTPEVAATEAQTAAPETTTAGEAAAPAAPLPAAPAPPQVAPAVGATPPVPQPIAAPQTPGGAAPALPPAPPPVAPAPHPVVSSPAAATSTATPPRLPGGVAGERPPSPPPPARPAFDWEGVVGVKLFSWVAAIAVLVAAVSFLRYGIDHGWLQPPVRMALGLITGVALLVVCELKAARKYSVTASALEAGGIAVLFATLYASNALWKLVPTLPTFLLMALVTAVAVALSVRRDSLFIALLGLVGGFSTPILMSTGEDRTLALFSYLLLLNVGLAWVAYRKRWPVLTLCSVALTAIYQWAWVVKFLQADRMATAALIFLVFPVAAVAMHAVSRPGGATTDGDGAFRRSTLFSLGLPLSLAVYFAAVPRFGGDLWLLFGYLLCVAVGLYAVAVWRGPRELHLFGAVSVLLVFGVWAAVSYNEGAWPGTLAVIGVFALFYLAAPIVAGWLGRPLEPPAALATLAAPLLLMLFPVLILSESACAAPGLVFGVLFALVVICAAYAVTRSELHVYYVAAVAAVLAEVVWSFEYLAADTLMQALVIYGVFALLFVAVSAWSTRAAAAPRGGSTGLLLIVASLCVLFFLTRPDVAAAGLIGLAVLLVLLSLAAYREAVVGGPVWLALAAVALAWAVLASWWAAVGAAVDLGGALTATVCLALATLAGVLWVSRRTATFDVGEIEVSTHLGAYLGLAGHLFLVGVAATPTLAIPPWALLATLLLLDLAVGAAGLYLGVSGLFAAAVLLSDFVLLCFAPVAKVAPWPAVAVLAGAGVAVLALLWVPAWSRRFAARGSTATAAPAITAVVALFLVQGLAVAVTGLPGRPSLTLLVAVHLACVAALLALAWRREWHLLAPLAALSCAVVIAVWSLTVTAAAAGAPVWQDRLVFAAALYAPFVLYPLLLGRRVKARLEPHLAAVLASAVFFAVGWRSFLDAGWGDVIGILPIAQAIIMCVLLVQLLNVEPPRARTEGRLALVAGTALAFVTVAIPLQLDKEWITISFALEAAALAWLFTRVRHEGLHFSSLALAGAAFVRLALNPEVMTYHPRTGTPIFNWFLYAYLVAAVAIFLAAMFLRRTDDRVTEAGLRSSYLLRAMGTVLLFLLLNIEIADAFSESDIITFRLVGGSLQQDLAYTLGWACFAIGLLAAGVIFRSRAARVASIVLLAVTALKAFLHDLARLGGLYRVASFVGLAVSLALVALALQKFVLAKGEGGQR